MPENNKQGKNQAKTSTNNRIRHQRNAPSQSGVLQESEASKYDEGIGIPTGKKVTESYDPAKAKKIHK